jgi:hypothetical protein
MFFGFIEYVPEISCSKKIEASLLASQILPPPLLGQWKAIQNILF